MDGRRAHSSTRRELRPRVNEDDLSCFRHVWRAAEEQSTGKAFGKVAEEGEEEDRQRTDGRSETTDADKKREEGNGGGSDGGHPRDVRSP